MRDKGGRRDKAKQQISELGIGTIQNMSQAGETLSGGQRQAVAVARAATFATRLIILDEPTAALGLRESARVLELIRRLRAGGVAVILISHSMDHVMAVADRAMVLRRGRKVGESLATESQQEQLVAWIVGARGS